MGMFAQKTALITGGSRGIGAATCRALARHGAFVYINYNSREADAERVLASIREAGGDGLTIRASVREEADVAQMFATIRKRDGRLDMLINNAGLLRDAYLGMMSLQDWQAVIDTNLTGLYLCSRGCHPG